MNRSEQVGELITALAKAQSEFTFAPKESKNPAFGSRYADLASVIAAVRPVLSRHGIALIQADESDCARQVASVTTSLHHGEQWIAVTAEAPAIDKNGFHAQSLGKAWTYLRRYTLQAITGLASEDDDANSIAIDSKPAAKKPNGVKLEWDDSHVESAILPKENPSKSQMEEWKAGFDECSDVEEFNSLVVPLMKERGREFIVAAAAEAKRRGYKVNRTTGSYEDSGAK